ncbi:MAG: hypothetical protein RR415_06165 [Ruthenibacterium sp.]
MFRLTKGGTQTFTVFYDDNTTFSWYWGRNGSSCVTDDVNDMGRMIRSCIENDLDIPVDGTTAYRKAGLKIQSKEDAKHATHLIKVIGTAEDHVFKSGDFIAFPAAGVKNVISFFESFGYSVQGDIVETEAPNGRPVKAFTIAR